MRTLSEIIDDVKSGGRPDYEELRYGMLVYQFLHFMDSRNLHKELTDPTTNELARKMKLENSFQMHKSALEHSPKDYIGSDDPDNPEYQRRRKIANNLAMKFLDKK